MRQYFHLYLRGNYQQEIIFDWIDYVNFWNRIWLAAQACDVVILAIELMDNHFHIIIMIASPEDEAGKRVSAFMHYLRMSVSYYYNRRYKVSGMLGCRRFGRAQIKNPRDDGGADLRDAICYTSRNVLHHGIKEDFWKWPWSTVRIPFRIVPPSYTYSFNNAPENILNQYLPYPNKLPDGWALTAKGIVIPSSSVYGLDTIEQLFVTKANYISCMSNRTRRETQGEDNESRLGRKPSGTRKRHPATPDTEISAWLERKLGHPVIKANIEQKLSILKDLRSQFPKASIRQFSRILAIPSSNISYRLKKSCTLS